MQEQRERITLQLQNSSSEKEKDKPSTIILKAEKPRLLKTLLNSQLDSKADKPTISKEDRSVELKELPNKYEHRSWALPDD